ncbi:general substrate transporter [Dothidotthia symphoricarpi CBS 119687]|uniref:General substrate transporter n=1 Tax=Dothidotthia symphoricarpi CBS 119687 TaxID=1392245 RepID=A0A6A6AHC3_9PLEO|nr:general substrate transporter [Dothidotthia symphoricarpi CBS 119687]KAF2130495.1 general substrate transporter [Dothidotthia symphoricarpi CBS 119687]
MDSKHNVDVVHREDVVVHAQPKADERPWYKQPELRKLYLMMPFLFLGSTTLGYDGSLLNGFAVLLFTPYIADILGRRTGTAVGCILVIVGSIIQALPHRSNPDAMFLAGRFIMGMGTNISNATCPLLITEVAHPRHRGRVTTIYNTLWYLGAILAAWTTYGTLTHISSDLSWRLPVGLQCAMPGVQLFVLFLLPESPRWLVSKNKHSAAKKMLTQYHGNGIETDFVAWEYNEISQTLEAEQAASSSSGWYELVRTPGNRKRCLLIILTAIFSQCSGNGLVSYYLAAVLKTIGITKATDQALINGGLTIWCFLVSLGCAFLVDRVGRRTLFLGAGLGMLVAFSVWTACSAVYARTGNSGAGSAVLAMIFIFYGAAGLAWPGLTVSYTVEILPFKIRAKGLTLCFVFTSLSGIFNQYVNPIGLEALGWKFYIVYVVVLILECLAIYFLYVETRGPTLEEIAILFDGKDAHVAGAEVTLNQKGEVRRPESGGC